jgi:DNA-binding response OmpR family regulator
MAKTAVLLVEDNMKLNIANQNMLKLLGYDVTIAVCLSEAQKALQNPLPDVIVLDIMLPDGNGLDFLLELRETPATAHIPVIILSALGKLDDRVRGLSTGADDYLAKPYEYKELAARIEALLRRAARVSDTIQKGSLKLDILAGHAFLNGKDLLLAKKEFSLLLLFVKNEGKALSPEYIFEAVWKQPMGDDDNALKKAISRLRKKMESSAVFQYDNDEEGYIFTSTVNDNA